MSSEKTTSPPADIASITDDDKDQGEQIINWEDEATAIINDVRTHVAEIDTSKKLPSNESHIYLNIRTFEGAAYCVHASGMGFRVVSEIYDTIDEDKEEINEEEVYETPYALLDKISPRYVESFGNQLCKQLLHLQQMRTEVIEEDDEGLEEEDEGEDEDKKTLV